MPQLSDGDGVLALKVEDVGKPWPFSAFCASLSCFLHLFEIFIGRIIHLFEIFDVANIHLFEIFHKDRPELCGVNVKWNGSKKKSRLIR